MKYIFNISLKVVTAKYKKTTGSGFNVGLLGDQWFSIFFLLNQLKSPLNNFFSIIIKKVTSKNNVLQIYFVYLLWNQQKTKYQ